MVVMFFAGVVICSGYILGPQIANDMIRQYRGLTPAPLSERLANLVRLIACGWVLAILFSVALLINSNLKPAISVLNAAHYDLELETIERTLFGGVLPSAWLITHSPGAAVHIWDFIYDLFGMFLFVSMMIAVQYEGMRGGARFVFALSAGLCVCLVVAVVFPTRGPLFVHPEWFGVLHDTESGRLARYLSHTVQQYTAAPGVRYAVAGIAAMPSFHVVSWTCGWLCWRPLPLNLRVVGVILVLCNWASTVVLGWHYALDGLVGIVIAVCVFRLAARVIPRTEHSPDRGHA